MTRTAFFRFATRLAWLMVFSAEFAMASSLQLATPQTLAGPWQVQLQTQPDTLCDVELMADKTLRGNLTCLAGLLARAPAGWFPEPDGLSLTDAKGSRLIHLGKQHEGLYCSLGDTQPVVVLQRKEAP